jgi:hypothetical protein
MVTGPLLLAAGTKTVALAVWGIVELILLIGWLAMFAILLGLLVLNILTRGRSQRRRAAAGLVATDPPQRVASPPDLTALRRADPSFDEQLLLDATLTASMLMFAASSTGQDAPIKRLAADSFWQTDVGKLTAVRARDRRREAAEQERDRAVGRPDRPDGSARGSDVHDVRRGLQLGAGHGVLALRRAAPTPVGRVATG